MLKNTGHQIEIVSLLTQWFVQSFVITAGPKLRAGFILDPVNGTLKCNNITFQYTQHILRYGILSHEIEIEKSQVI